MEPTIIKEQYKYSEITSKIIGCAMTVHKILGNGFQEVIYQRALAIEMRMAGISFSREHDMPIFYRDEQIGTRRVDLKKDLFTKEMQGENKLLQQSISSLQAKIKEQESLIASLNEKANIVGAQGQTIALKALDSASSLRYSTFSAAEKREHKDGGK